MKPLIAVLIGSTLLLESACTSSGGATATATPTLTAPQLCATLEVENATATPDVPAMSTAAAQGTPFTLVLCPGSEFRS
jgi:hypothetical protein